MKAATLEDASINGQIQEYGTSLIKAETPPPPLSRLYLSPVNADSNWSCKILMTCII